MNLYSSTIQVTQGQGEMTQRILVAAPKNLSRREAQKALLKTMSEECSVRIMIFYPLSIASDATDIDLRNYDSDKVYFIGDLKE
jgi:hypothetical protein